MNTQNNTKPILDALSGKTTARPPVWLMRQAGRYLPEYRKTRKKAGSFLELCYNPDLATEVTLQPIRRFELDASILFADILLVPQALGMDLWFVEGEGPRLKLPDGRSYDDLAPASDIHEILSPVYQTVRNLAGALPSHVTLIGFAGAPWTVATYMIAGKGSSDQGPARKMMFGDPKTFDALIERITLATIEYLSAQIDAGAEVVKLFDSWAGAVSGPNFERYVVDPMVRIRTALKERHPSVPVIAFPRGAGARYAAISELGVFDGLALDSAVPTIWARDAVQKNICVQGNLDPMLMVVGGDALKKEAKRIANDLSNGPHIFNLGHGITPDANPDNVNVLIDAINE